ncbi:ribosylnicotinamide kinase homolog [Bacteroides reticulotermitis JCM 10512]|uniref:Ribosylnicotinamide kinase homolog n=1 Tax=Bacteroides reticulotermitis JCM 10512 TaxID=1445607 RepID=W4UR38_9BACE|nr:ribosylnicotinamide kinase homolog [Bacteroides reticulotermitis JCM 10512]
MITTQDKDLLAKKGISEAQIAEQMACFQKGFPFLKLDAAASLEKGILAPTEEQRNEYLENWDAYRNTDRTIVKFVPASGAASRMFKDLFEFLSADYEKPTTQFEEAFFDGIGNFAFYDDLNTACLRTAGNDIPALLEEGNYKAVVAALLETAGLNYGALPKGLLKFHKYPEGHVHRLKSIWWKV